MASNVHLTSLHGQVPIRIKGNTKCSIHRTKDVILHCTDCSILVCLSCSISTHSGHALVEISDIALQKKNVFRDFIHDTEKNKLIQLHEEIQSVENKLLENDTNFKELGQQVKKQGKVCKDQMDVLTEEFVSICDNLEKLNRELLLKYKEELQQRYKSLLGQVRECKKLQQSGTDVQVYDSVSDLSVDDIPEAPVLHEADFHPYTVITEQLQKALGMLNTSAGPQKSSLEEVQPKAIAYASTFQEDFLDELVELTKFKSPLDCTSICPTTSGAWINDNDSDVLLFVDAKGQPKQRIEYPCGDIRDISISRTGNVWFCCDDNFTINEVTASSFALVIRFEVEDWPTCILITKEGNVLVGTRNGAEREGNMSMYTKEGQLLLSTSAYKNESSLRTPLSISQCSVTGNFAVNSTEKEDDGSWFRNILVYDQELKFKWDISEDGAEGATEKSSFRPRCAEYDSKGHLVIVEHGTNAVKLMSGTGQHLRTFIVGNESSSIVAIGVQPDDILWVRLYTFKLEKRGMLRKLLSKQTDCRSEIHIVKYYKA